MKAITYNLVQVVIRLLLLLIFAVSLVVIFAWDTEGTTERFTIVLAFKLAAFGLLGWSYKKMADIGLLKWLSR